ncbi:CHASE2 domain-containing protein [Paraburkholderia xenovorans]|uniref:CHASE2 domain-containing protein n=1 Tax=Paraburkholderia xenovorans TaxID=36873 RepID=UPI0015593F42|nr:CHASE2 domain-containing protein [Paraburkholderia xenovorans]NPT34593.1 CHASE2 domain-containing protein [Paraburkholderia xenovorans]
MATQNGKQERGKEKHEKPGWRHLLGRAALSVLLGLLLALVVPTRFTEEMGAQTMARYAAPFSGYWFDVGSEHERDLDRESEIRRERGKVNEHPRTVWNDKDITVLVIDREALKAKQEGWPARYPFYTWLLGVLNAHPPASVFVDVILSQPKGPGFDDFKRSLADLISKKTGVYLAARRTEDNRLATNDDLDEDQALKAVKRVGIEFSAHAVDRLAWTYPLVYAKEEHNGEQTVGVNQITDKDMKWRNPSQGNCPLSAAFAIYEDVYGRGDLEAQCDEPRFMSVTWPLDTAEDGLRWLDSDDEESEVRRAFLLRVDTGDHDEQMYCTSSDSELRLLWRAESRAFLRPTSRPLCVHYRTIHASQIEQMSVDEQAAAFRDRIVMIGTSFDYSNDFVLSPLNDRIPGVFLHAAALDNLFSHRGGLDNIEAWEPQLDMPAVRWGKLLFLSVIGFVAIFLIAGAKKWVRQEFARFYHERRHWNRRFSLHWWCAKALTAIFNIALFCLSGFALVAFGVGMIVFGTHLHMPFLLIAHVLACTIAVEWLEWSEHLFNWVTDSKED